MVLAIIEAAAFVFFEGKIKGRTKKMIATFVHETVLLRWLI